MWPVKHSEMKRGGRGGEQDGLVHVDQVWCGGDRSTNLISMRMIASILGIIVYAAAKATIVQCDGCVRAHIRTT